LKIEHELAGITANFFKVCLKANSIRDGDTPKTRPSQYQRWDEGVQFFVGLGCLTTISLNLEWFNLTKITNGDAHVKIWFRECCHSRK